MKEYSLHRLFGLGGVSECEPARARKIGRYVGYATTCIAIVLAVQWYAELDVDLDIASRAAFNWMIWGYFVLSYIFLFCLVKNKRRYFVQNWLMLLIIIQGVFLVLNLEPVAGILRELRLLLVVLLMIPWLDLCRDSLSDQCLTTTILTAFIIVVLSGILIAGIDPNIHTPWQGIWWAWVTVSTVGYGDVVPVSVIGRIFAMGLILMGLCLFAVLTANFSALFVKREVEKEGLELHRVVHRLQALQIDDDAIITQLKDINAELKAMHQRLDKIEEKKKE